MLERALSLLRNVDLSLLEPLDQIVGREVDQLDGIGAVKYGIRYRLAHSHMGNLGDNVIEAFDVLNIDRGVNVDAVTHQLFDVEVAFRMTAALGVGMGKLVNQHDLRMPRDDGVQVHLGKMCPFVFNVSAWNDFEAAQQRFGLLAAMRLDDSNDDVIAILLARLGLLQHLVGLADAGCGADENAQLADASLFAARGFQ